MFNVLKVTHTSGLGNDLRFQQILCDQKSIKKSKNDIFQLWVLWYI